MPINNSLKNGNVLRELHEINERSSNEELATPITSLLEKEDKRNDKIITFRIYLSKISQNKECEIEVSAPSYIKSDSLLNLIFIKIKEKSIYRNFKFAIFSEMFSLWLVSTELEIPLKSYHSPFRLSRQWSTLIERFTDSNDSVNDKPILMLRRNPNLNFDSETQILDDNPTYATLLIEDVYDNLLIDRYIVENDKEICINLAVLLFVYNYGKYNKEIHDDVFILSKFEDIIPERIKEIITSKKLLGMRIHNSRTHEEKITKKWMEMDDCDNISRKIIYFLIAYCHNYGAALFEANIVQKPSFLSRKTFLSDTLVDKNVLIGINHSWITITESETNKLLFVQWIDEINWKLDDESESCLMFYSSSPSCSSSEDEGIERNDTNYMMVKGKQVVLINSYLNYVNVRTTGSRSTRSSSSSSSTAFSEGQSALNEMVQSRKPLLHENICLARINNGVCVKSSVKNIVKSGQKIT